MDSIATQQMAGLAHIMDFPPSISELSQYSRPIVVDSRGQTRLPSHGSFEFSQGTCVGLLGELDEEQELLREKEYLITPCPPQPNTEAPCSIELHTLNKHRAPL